MSAAEIYSPEPNLLERKFAAYLAQRGAGRDSGDHPSRESVQKIARVTKWVIVLSALAGIVSGGLIGGAEIWMRYGLLDGMDHLGWREALPYWLAFYAFAGLVSAVEIALLYGLALSGIARVTQHSGLQLARGDARGLFSHSLARAALEFPSPQVRVYGIDPYAYVANWKLTALNIAYKLKVGVSSFLLRVFLRRVAARVAIRGMIPLFAGPLYAVWNAYIVWRIMTEARVRTLGPFVVDNLIAAHFRDTDDVGDTEKQVILHGAGEMLTRGRDAHPNQIYLMTRLRAALDQDGDITLDWPAMRGHLKALDAVGQTRVLDLLTVSCVIGVRIRREQMELLRSACQECGATLHEDRMKDLHKAVIRGHQVKGAELAATRHDTRPGSA
ncbi:MAG: LBF_2804 family protein [Salinarimonas sp.]